jgi:tagatose 1,6-diphosphate aldolase
MTTAGKYRHLTQCSTPAGHFCILAIDHRGNLWQSLNERASAPLTSREFADFKALVTRNLTPAASAILTDPQYGIFPGIASRAISGQIGILAPLEVTDYNVHPSQRALSYIPDWGVENIKRIGGAGVKLLFYYHPEAPNAVEQRDHIARIIEECGKYEIPFFCEPIAYSLDSAKSLANAELYQVVIESAATFSRMGIDVLKTEFPLDVKQEPDETRWDAALQELNRVCSVPWALLSAGTTYDVFKKQVMAACRAGASGVIVGRAVWTEAVALQGAERENFLATTGRQRMDELAAICAEYARPWHGKVASP